MPDDITPCCAADTLPRCFSCFRPLLRRYADVHTLFRCFSPRRHAIATAAAWRHASHILPPAAIDMLIRFTLRFTLRRTPFLPPFRDAVITRYDADVTLLSMPLRHADFFMPRLILRRHCRFRHAIFR